MFRINLKTRKIDQIDIVPKCSYYQPSIFDELLFDDSTRCSDITFIFNQQRLDKVISKDNFDAYFSALLRDGSPNPYDGMSDDDIMSLVKDRRLSTFNDWYNYTKNLNHDFSELKEFKEQLEHRNAKHIAERERIDAALQSLESLK